MYLEFMVITYVKNRSTLYNTLLSVETLRVKSAVDHINVTGSKSGVQGLTLTKQII